MSKIVLLDSGPLGIVTNPKAASPLSQEGKLWLQSLPLKGYIVVLPEIADYEVRRELIRAGKVAGIRRLDELKSQIPYRPLTTENALDGDVILAAQAILLANEANEVVIATTNVGHLSQFVDAREWRSIS
ncbi:nucleic acid-binding protein [Microcoleus sp. PH2017_02_FOX_O_A]|uniref:nucleic acid-binding protein n=1 Tax=Microcoleus sp. PH2017_02_FOX_O_A TaxID=2798813 RepID=UPI001D3542BE|nr:nucleic acid-binding protein [Microcoleus sp. PH2017_02_FOX_O_A]MCC3411091.1 nucleic acid-binding protein [Microcoleus sp. PH2017_02_FOX_O_A]